MADRKTYKDILLRLHEATGSTTQVGLAAAFGVVQSTVAYWLQKRSIPFWCLDTLYQDHKINPFWILNGSDEKFIENYPGVEVIREYIEEHKLPISFSMQKKTSSTSIEINSLKTRLNLSESKADSLNPKQNANFIDKELYSSHYSTSFHASSSPSSNSENLLVSVYSSKYTGLSNEKGNVYQLERKILMPRIYYKDSYTAFSFKSVCMEPAVMRDALITIDTSSTDFVSGKIYAFAMPNQELTLAYVELPLHETRNKISQVSLVFENKAFPTLVFPYEAAKKYLVGRLIALYNFYE